MTENLIIERLTDMSAFVIFNRVNWHTSIIGYSKVIDDLQDNVNNTLSTENFTKLTAQEQIDMLFKEGYWDTFK
tara:strand:+ start:179 stop:400 length:222 start_codon:yes stop_codon:yes gene_type:complete